MTGCCDTYGDCTQGRQCPKRTGIVLPHQANHAAQVAKSHPYPAGCDSLPVQFVGPEPINPTRPMCDCWPLTPRETNQVIAGMCFFLAVFVGVVAFGLTYGWVRFGRDLVAYLVGGAA
jgi:hypothetical protein